MIEYQTFETELRRIFSQDPKLNEISFEKILEPVRTVDQLPSLPQGQTVLMRLDLDVPLKDGAVEDPSRIESNLRTLRYALDKGWRVVIMAHLGRAKFTSLQPVCDALSKEIGQSVIFVPDWLDESTMKLKDEAVAKVAAMAPGSALMLDNTRNYAIERALWTASEETFPAVCRDMYTLATDLATRVSNVFIHEAIASSNFDFSTSVLPLVMSATAYGFYISEEMKKHMADARRANLVVISGLKADKLDDLESILTRGTVQYLIAAGSLAMALIKARAQAEGKEFSLGRAETNPDEIAYMSPERLKQGGRILQKCIADGVKLILPIDFVLDNGEVSATIPADHVQFDIGPASRKYIDEEIGKYIQLSKQSPDTFVMFYNGVFGKFEDAEFAHGTQDFVGQLPKLTQAGVRTYVGGGEGLLALLKYGKITDVTHAFTAGGTVLKSLSDRHIQYLKAMYLQNTQAS